MADKKVSLDYTMEFGSFENQNEVKDSTGFRTKLNALLNLMNMRPGTVQDNPFMGIDMDGLQFAEGEEISTVRSRICNAIKQQADRYIEDGFIESVSSEIVNAANAVGYKDVKITIKLSLGPEVTIASEKTNSGLVYKILAIDKTTFN